MAVNLRNGLSPDFTLLVADVNKDAISRFQKQAERKGAVEVVSNRSEAAKAAVCYQLKKSYENVRNLADGWN